MRGRRVGVKGFLSSRIGKIILMVVAILTVLGAFLFAGVLFAILAVLVFGLGVPIWVGASQPRYLAVLGVAVLAVSPALITAVEVPIILTPPGVASSVDGVMQNATLTPFQGSAGAAYNWTVDVFPANLPPGYNTTNITLYISTCPGATGNSSPYCSSGYPLYALTRSIPNLSRAHSETLHFNYTLPTADIWNWQMGLYYGRWNASAGRFSNLTFDLLKGDPNYYNGIEGPVTTDWGGVYGLLVGSIYVETALYLGLIFYIALLVYVIFRVRRQRRQQASQRARPPPPTEGEPTPLPSATGPGEAPPPSAPPAGGAAPKEVACPNCGAVVYPNETFCWKCGTALGAKGGGPKPPAEPKG